jgi:hypothetical protein
MIPRQSRTSARSSPEAIYDSNSHRVVLIAENFVPHEGETLERIVRRLVFHEASATTGWRASFRMVARERNICLDDTAENL